MKEIRREADVGLVKEIAKPLEQEKEKEKEFSFLLLIRFQSRFLAILLAVHLSGAPPSALTSV